MRIHWEMGTRTYGSGVEVQEELDLWSRGAAQRWSGGRDKNPGAAMLQQQHQPGKRCRTSEGPLIRIKISEEAGRNVLI